MLPDPRGKIEPMTSRSPVGCPPKLLDFRVHTVTSDKTQFQTKNVFIFFLFLNENICCGYSIEVPHRGTSNEYPQHMFSLRNKKNCEALLLSTDSICFH